MRLALALFLLLAACAAPGGLRDPGAPITSIVAFDPARFAGTWYEVAALGRAKGSRWDVAVDGAGLAVTTGTDGVGQGRVTGPGRFTLSSFDAPLWVLWVDADYRTLVLGTPDGSFASVLDRSASGSPDRLRAARDILAWNGYRVAP